MVTKKIALSDIQQGMLFQSLYDKGITYISQSCIEMAEPVDVDRLWLAWDTLVARHDIFKSSIDLDSQDGTYFHVHDKPSLSKKFYDCSKLSLKEKNKEIKNFLTNDLHNPFDLSKPTLMRLALFKLATKKYILVCTYHHVIMCANAGLKVLLEVYGFYDSVEKSGSFNLNSDSNARPLEEYFNIFNNPTEKDGHYFKNELGGIDEITGSMGDKVNASKKSRGRKRVSININSKNTAFLKSFARSNGVTLNILFQAAWALLLSRYTNSENVIFGIVRSFPKPLMRDLIGLFINTLPLKINIEQGLTLEALLSNLKNKNNDIKKHILEAPHKIKQKNKAQNNLLFQSVVEYKPQTLEYELKEISQEWQKRKITFLTNTHYPLFLEIFGEGLQTKAILAFDPGKFSKNFANQLLRHWVSLLLSFQDKSLDATKLSMLNAVEANNLLSVSKSADSISKILKDKTISDLFNDAVNRYPENIALQLNDEVLTYQDLRSRVKQLAALISSHGVKSGSFIGIICSRTFDMVISILATFMAGCAYVPIDPEYPKNRIQYIIKDSGLDFLLVDSSTVNVVTNFGIKHIVVGAHHGEVYSSFEEVANDLAYLIYTSGTTGQPKGTLISQYAVVNAIYGVLGKIGFSSQDCFLAITSMSFDISVLELIGPLFFGGKVLISPDGANKNFEVLSAYINNYQPDIIQATPALWNGLADFCWNPASKVKIISGGEPLSSSLASFFTDKNIELWNAYGPTEATIWSSLKKITGSEVTLGRAIANLQIYLCDIFGNIVPNRVIGEICIGGMGLALGYKGNDALTKKQFTELHLQNGPVTRVYKTGDLAKRLPHGELIFVGRKDRQIKLNGYRIELEEIEKTLCNHPKISNAVVTLNGDVLSAYMVPKNIKYADKTDFSLFFFPVEEIGKNTQEDPYNLLLRIAKYADEHRFKAIWTPERHFNPVAGQFPNPSIISSALAMATKRIEIRAGSIVFPLHDPVRLVEDWSVIDHLSKGRIGISFASGWNPKDFTLAPHNYASRKDITEAYIAQFLRLWSGKPVLKKDGLGVDTEINIYPAPYSKKIPLWFTVSGDTDSFVRAGRLGMNLLTHLLGQTANDLKNKIQIYKKSLTSHGYDANSFTVTVMLHTYIAKTDDIAIKACERPFKNYLRQHASLLENFAASNGINFKNLPTDELEEIINAAFNRYVNTSSLIGSIETCRKRISQFKEIGINEFACLVDFGLDAESILESLGEIEKLHGDSAQSNALDIVEVRSFLKESIPAYMMPDRFYLCSDIEKTVGGKVDYSNLHKYIVRDEVSSVKDYRNFQVTPLSEELIRCWGVVLKIDVVYPDDNFFDLGGNSLLAMKLISLVSDKVGKKLPIAMIFNNPVFKDFYHEAVKQPKILVEEKQINKTVNFALTPVQKAYYMGRSPGFTLGNIGTHSYFEWIAKDVDHNKLEHSFNMLIIRHPMLRAVIGSDEGQKILDHVPKYIISLRDISAQTDKESFLGEIRSRLSHKLYGPKVWPSFSVELTKLNEAECIIHCSFDAIFLDGNSLKILFQEWDALYHGIKDLPQATRYYGDYIGKLENLRKSESYEASKKYWLDKLAKIYPAPQLNFGAEAELIDLPSFKRISHTISLEKWDLIKLRIKDANLSQSCFFLYLFAFLLDRWSQHKEHFTINLTIFNRPEGFERTLGDFTSTVLHTIDTELLTENEWKKKIKYFQNNLFSDVDNAIFDGVEVQRELVQHKKKEDGYLLFPIVFTSVLGENNYAKEKHGLFDQISFGITQTSQVYLDYKVYEFGSSLIMEWDYEEKVINPEYVDEIFKQYCHLVEEVGVNWPEALPPCVSQKYLTEIDCINSTYKDFEFVSLPWLILKNINQYLDKIAIYNNGKLIIYADLLDNFLRLCSLLKLNEIQQGDNIAIYLDKGWEQVVACVAIVSLGCTFVPLSIDWPKNRIEKIASTINFKAIIGRDSDSQKIRERFFPTTKLILIDRIKNVEPLKFGAILNIISSISLNDIAYVIFTSGSTGEPKGVQISHMGAVNTLLSIIDRFGVTSSDKVFAISHLTFDLSIFDIFALLAVGGEIVIPADREFASPKDWLGMFNERKVTIWNSAPALLQLLLDSINTQKKEIMLPFRLVMLSGDWIPITMPNELKKLCNSVEVVSLGGATEASIWSIYHVVGDNDFFLKSIPYGIPLANQSIYVLDTRLRICPVGVTGSILIGGMGLMKGYVGQEDLSREKFVIHPVLGRLYKTGDLGKYLANGEIQLLGREDSQVKIAGQRIELSEIENILEKNKLVKRAVIVAFNRKNDDQKNIAAFLSLQDTVFHKTDAIEMDFPIRRIDENIKTDEISGCFEENGFQLQSQNQTFYEKYVKNRNSYRVFGGGDFSISELIGFLAGIDKDSKNNEYPSNLAALSELLIPLSAFHKREGNSKYFYPSAGSYYAVNVFIKIYKNGCGGYFHFHPLKMCLIPLGISSGVASELLSNHYDQIEFYYTSDLTRIMETYSYEEAMRFSQIEVGHMIGATFEINYHFRNWLPGFLFFPLADDENIRKYTNNQRVIACLKMNRADKDKNSVKNIKQPNRLRILALMKQIEFGKEVCSVYEYHFNGKISILFDKVSANDIFLFYDSAIFASASFALIFVTSNFEVNPFYEAVFSGIISQKLILSGIENSIGFCPIGNINLSGLKNILKIDDINFLYCLIGGKVNKSDSLNIKDIYPDINLFTNEYFKKYLESWLPRGVIPQQFILIDNLPLTESGKVDRASLERSIINQDISRNKIVHNNVVEEVWSDILHIDNPSLNDNFFKSGGTSLDMLRLFSKLNAITKRNIAIDNFLKNPSLDSAMQLFLFGENTKVKLADSLPFSLISDEVRHKLPANVIDAYPLTYQQLAIIFYSFRAEHNVFMYKNANGILLDSKLDPIKIKDTINKIVIDQPLLRTAFNFTVYKEPLQLVYDTAELPVVFYDRLNKVYSKLEIAKIFKSEMHQIYEDCKFDIYKPPLAKVFVVNYGALFGLIFISHHSIIDGWSTLLFFKNFFERYLDYQTFDVAKVGDMDPENHFTKFVINERGSKFDHGDMGSLTSQYMDSKKSLTNISDNLEPANLSELSINSDILRQLIELAKENGVTLQVVLFCVYLKSLSIYLARDDLATGIIVNMRENSVEAQTAFGMYSHILPLRVDISSISSWKVLVSSVNNLYIDLLSDKYNALKKYIEQGAENLHNLIVFNYIDYFNAFEENKEKILYRGNIYNDTNAPLSVIFDKDVSENAFFVFQFKPSIFSDINIEHLQKCFIDTLNEICSNKYIVNKFDSGFSTELVSKASLEDICISVNHWGVGENRPIKNANFSSMLAHCFAEYHDKVAIESYDNKITYHELTNTSNDRATTLKNYLQPASCVAVLQKRSVDFVANVVSIVMAKFIYLPLDIKSPSVRLKSIVEMANISAIIVDSDLLDNAKEILAEKTIKAFKFGYDSILLVFKKLNTIFFPTDALYVIFTSGSTGSPKGIINLEAGAVNHLLWLKDEFKIGVGDAFLLRSHLAFDASISELFLPLISGAKVVVCEDDAVGNPDKVIDTIQRFSITILQTVPTFLKVLVINNAFERCPTLKYVISGGEILSPKVADMFYLKSNATLYNFYGLSEASVDSCYWKVVPGQVITPLGYPIYNTTIRILNENMLPVLPGEIGELYIGGVGLAYGYIDKPLTESRFVTISVLNKMERLFRTGDSAKWLENGVIEFCGRLDNLVKHHGHRIQLEEITKILLRNSAIEQAVCLHEKQRGIIAFVKCREDNYFQEKKLMEFLRGYLPEYMIPCRIHSIKNFNLLPNGKIDINALLQRKEAISPRASIEHLSFQKVRQQLCTLVEDVLGFNEIPLDEDIFKYDFSSINAIKLISSIYDKFKIEVKISEFFENNTIVSLAHYIFKKLSNIDNDKHYVVIREGGNIPLFFIHPVSGEVLCYKKLVEHLNPNIGPIYGIISSNTLVNSDEYTMEAISERYAETIQKLANGRPINIIGWSLGALIVHSIAGMLEKHLFQVGFLGMVDVACLLNSRENGDWISPLLPMEDLLTSLELFLEIKLSDILNIDLSSFVKEGKMTMHEKFFSLLQAYFIAERQEHKVEKLHIFVKNLFLGQKYHPPLISSRITLFQAAHTLSLAQNYSDATLGWAAASAKGASCYVISGDHRTIMEGSYVKHLAEKLESSINSELLAVIS